MKKLSLIVGALLLVATASAKEVVAAPVVVEEVVVEEAPVIEAPIWKPSGSFYWEAEYRGNNEKSRKNEDDKFYNDMVGELAITEKDTIWFEWESYNGIHGDSNTDNDSQDMEMRWYHNFGYLADSKIDMTSEINVEFDDDGGAEHNYYSARMYFDFAEYVTGNDKFNITKLALRPRVQFNDYSEKDNQNNGGDYAVGTGLDLLLLAETQTEDYGLFEYELSFYNTYFDGNTTTRSGYDADEGTTSVNTDKDGNIIDYDSNGVANQIEAYLYHTINLWESQTGVYSIDFKQEGGLDPITWTESEDSVTVYYEPRLRLHQKINEATSLRYSVGSYYKNYESNGADHTADFRWEPRVGVAIKTVF